MLEQLILNILTCSDSMTGVPVPLLSADDPKKLSGLGKSNKGDNVFNHSENSLPNFTTEC